MLQAHREPQWGPVNHYRGALSQPHSIMCRDREGGMSPHHSTKGLGEHRQLPSGVRKWILCIFQVRKKLSGTSFPVFWATAGPPKSRGAWGNFPPPIPSSWRAYDVTCKVQSQVWCSVVFIACMCLYFKKVVVSLCHIWLTVLYISWGVLFHLCSLSLYVEH